MVYYLLVWLKAHVLAPSMSRAQLRDDGNDKACRGKQVDGNNPLDQRVGRRYAVCQQEERRNTNHPANVGGRAQLAPKRRREQQ